MLDQAVSTSSADDQKRRIINEIGTAFEASRPWSDAHQAGNRWIVPWIENELNVRRYKAKDLIRQLIHEGKVVMEDVSAHDHRRGLCTLAQSGELSAKQNAKQRKSKR